MKNRILFLSTSMTVALLALVLLNSCSSDEPVTFESDPEQFCSVNPTDTRCFTVDPDAFCSANPLDGQCCIPSQDIDCYCSTDDNGTTDLENCCLFEYNVSCFCEANPDDSRCAQDFGAGNGVGILYDFEGWTSSDAVAESVTDPFNMEFAQFNGLEGVEAIEGDTYLSLEYKPVANAQNKWNDFKFWPAFDTDSPSDKLLDLSTIGDPYINFWIHTGANEADSMAFTIAFRDETIGVDYDNDYLFKDTSGGEWKLLSIRLGDETFRRAYNNDESGSLRDLAPEMKFTMVKLVFRSAGWAFSDASNTDYVAAIDAISITDGPLEQLPWIK